ncbi:MAG: glycine betaine ABC transporter substrate-binding protein [bacterium]
MIKGKKLFFAVSIVLIIASLFLAACSSKKDSNSVTIKIGAPHYGEPVLTANMAKLLLEDRTEHNIQLITNLGTTSIILDQALRSNEIDIAALLWSGGTTGTQHPKFLEEGLVDPNDPKWRDVDTVLAFLREKGPEVLNREYIGPLGFENTYAIVVTKETAARYNLEKMSDLKGLSQDFIVGMDDSYMDWPIVGYPFMLEWYELEPFKQTVQMNIGLLYEAVAQGDLDVGIVYSTDSRIGIYDLVWLEDDLDLYYPYDAVYGVSLDILEKAPEIRDVLGELTNRIDISDIHRMNAEVDVEERDPEEVAKEFLEEIGLL